ncbi:hypothetical protein F511_10557 [Dorcoceras hygrometricum]|uniref:Uncharacterized protein n=1 Tax=Dorcoceras hygrometricum TaxID=472368 RepID=A0A2Z7BNS0_9LAMI|nr:hypothetical protein F511_10557 [Dorcoceras hygrometricum]
MRIRPPEIEKYLRFEVPCFIGREHYDVLSMQIDSDQVIYRTTLVRTFQVVTICRVDKSEVLVVLISPHDSKHRSDQIVDRSYDEVMLIGMNRILKCRFPRETGRIQAPRRQQGNFCFSPASREVGSGSTTAFPTDHAPLCVFIEPVQDINSRPSVSRAISIVWAEICMEAVQFYLLGSLRPVGSVNFCRDLVVRGSVVEVLETLPIHFRRIIRHDLVSSEGSIVYRSPSPIFQETGSFDSPGHLNRDDIPLEENVNVQTTFPTATADLSPLLDDLKTSLSQRMDNAHSDILSRLHTIERGLQNTLGHQNDYFRNLIQCARQEGQNQDDLQILRLNELKKTVMAQGVAAIRSEQLEFQAKMAADLLSLSTQIGDLIDYIRGGDARMGEGSSSRRTLPTPVNQGESSGNVIRTTEIILQTDIDAAQRYIMKE